MGGDAAAYFDPTDVDEMAAAIDRLLTSPDEYRQRKEMGLNQVKKFSWKKAAAETMQVYDLIREQHAA